MRYFITGTDTGIGKTFVLSLIIKYLISKGVKPYVMKPIETGCINQGGKLVPEDAQSLAKITGLEDRLDDVCPYRFELPLAPYVASRLEKREISVDKIKEVSEKFGEPLFVEGAGGLMVPVLKNFFMVDLAKYLGLEVIFIAPLRLGTINHTLLSIEAMEKRGVAIKGIIMNDTDGIETVATKTNPEVLTELQPHKLIGVVPFKAEALPVSLNFNL
ncbi:MAG: dethiobiotin synthase [bacterium]